VIVASAVARVSRSQLGCRFLAVRSDEAAAAAAGIDVVRTKLLAYALSSFIAGVGGAILGYSRGQLSADSFGVFVGIGFVVAVYLGGITSVTGALIAGLLGPLGIVYVINDRLLSGERWYALASGLALLGMLVVCPDGLAATAGRRLRRAPVPANPPPHRAEASARGGGISAVPTPPAGQAGLRSLPALQLSGLTVRYGGVTAVDCTDLAVRPGELVGLVGPNGAGKSSLIDAVSGFTPYTGSVQLRGVCLDGLAAHARQRAGLARTWQSTRLVDELTVIENLNLATRPWPRARLGRAVEGPTTPKVDVLDLLHTVGATHLTHRRTGDLTPGERKLVDLGRALAGGPAVVLADEPAAGLNTAETQQLGRHLRQICDQGIGVLLVDHDLGLVREICERLVVLDLGRLIADGATSEVLASPDVAAAYLGPATVSAAS
jgi:ABC-type branched-subunit amino acid transport system ATPase component